MVDIEHDDSDYNTMLNRFTEHYPQESALIDKFLQEVVKDLPSELKKANIFFQEPIINRIKTVDSALGSLERRRKDWQGKRGRGNGSMNDSTPQYSKYEEMVQALYDIGGARILLYSPGEAKKVVNVLRNYEKIKFKEAKEIPERRTVPVESSQEDIGNSQEVIEGNVVGETIFPGYRATHVHVCNPKAPQVVIEIQISTVVMSAWSQVAHDYIYKPTKSEPVRDVELVLDTLNGIVLAGENLLRQLEYRNESQKKNDETAAKGIYELGNWLVDLCAEENLHPLENEVDTWGHLQQLLDVLRAVKWDKRGKLRDLIGSLKDLPNHERFFCHQLPVYLMWQLHSSYEKKPSSPHFEYGTADLHSARFLAQRVIRTLNMAAYLFEAENLPLTIFATVMPQEVACPTMTDFLDILHPDQPRIRPEGIRQIRRFCQDFLNKARVKEDRREQHDRKIPLFQLIKRTLPALLVEIGIEAYPTSSSRYNATEMIPVSDVIVQRNLCELLEDPHQARWVPDLCSIATQLCKFDSNDGVLLPIINHMDGENATPLLLTDASVPRRPGSQKYTAFTFQPNGLKIQVGPDTAKPELWWNWVRNQGGSRDIFKYHANKEAPRPRSRPGYFRASPGSQSSKWKYSKIMPGKWKLRTNKTTPEEEQKSVEIKWLYERKDELIDLAKSILETGEIVPESPSDGPPSSYTLTINQAKLSLQSTPNEFILSRAREEAQSGSSSMAIDTNQIQGNPEPENREGDDAPDGDRERPNERVSSDDGPARGLPTSGRTSPSAVLEQGS